VRIRLLASLLTACALAGCGGSAATSTGVTGNAEVRFLHGSPDQPAIDWDLPAGTAVVSGQQFKTITAYQSIAAGTYSVGATPHGSTTLIQPPTGNNNLSLQANHRYTIVLGGSAADLDQQLCIFDEPLFTTATGTAAVQFNNCTPTNSGLVGTETVGYYPPGTPASSVALGNGISFAQNSGIFTLPSSAASGVGFYTGSPTEGSLLPVQLDSTNTTNALPFVNDQNVSVFILDGPIGGSTLTLVGALDPNN
jgi:hypothetical protein